MVNGRGVSSCVPIGRRVATTNVTARETQTQMNPARVRLETFLAPLGGERRGDLVHNQMLATFVHLRHQPGSIASASSVVVFDALVHKSMTIFRALRN